MPPCKNDSGAHYTGKEPSPKGNGWCAHAMRPGIRKRGTDGRMWVVAVRATGAKYWKRIAGVAPKRAAAVRKRAVPAPKRVVAPKRAAPKRDSPKKLKPSEAYPVRVPRPRWAVWLKAVPPRARKRLSDLIYTVLPALRKQGIVAEIIPLPKDRAIGSYWIDQAWDWVRDVKGWDGDAPMMLAMVRYDRGKLIVRDTISIQHNGIGRHKAQIIQTMQDAFGKAFSWNGTKAKAMMLSMVG